MDAITSEHEGRKEGARPWSQAAPVHRVRVWDLPTRLFHWTLALAFLVAAVSSEDQWLQVHVLAGYLIAGLLVFRLLWGFAGGYYSRFAQFSYSYAQVKAHLLDLLIGRNKHYLSHNPAGSWSVMIMLGGCAVVVFGGLLLLGGEEQHGIAQSISPLFGNIALWLHIIAGNLLIAFVFVHIAGVFVDSRLTGINLVKSMLNGYKAAAPGSISVKPGRPAAVFMMLVVAAVAAGLLAVDGSISLNPLKELQKPPLPHSQLWQDSCSDCHMAWHPSLLPSRSWKQLLARQDRHFGEDLFLDKADIDRLLRFALDNSADHGRTEPARKINSSIPRESTPLRIIDTPYWKHKHEEIGASIWKRQAVGGKANCEACHKDARQGLFEDGAMHIPSH